MSGGRWRSLWWLGFIGLLPLVVPGFEALRLFLLFFLVPLLGDLLFRGRRAEEGDDEPPLPLPAPAQRMGEAGLLVRYQLSAILMLFNPFQLVQLVRQVVGEHSAALRLGSFAPTPESYRQAVAYRLPFHGEWLITNGGTTPERSHSWDLIGQRYAYDFVVADSDGVRHTGRGARKEDYLCYGAAVLAPAAGVVVRVRDRIRDSPWVGSGWVDWLSRDFTGNSVIIRHADSEFSFAAHLIPGSINVRPGMPVKQGEEIGRCGHSGHSTEPHLHFQVQDRPNFFGAAALPVRFTACVVDGVAAPGPVLLQRGMRVRAAEPPAAREPA